MRLLLPILAEALITSLLASPHDYQGVTWNNQATTGVDIDSSTYNLTPQFNNYSTNDESPSLVFDTRNRNDSNTASKYGSEITNVTQEDVLGFPRIFHHPAKKRARIHSARARARFRLHHHPHLLKQSTPKEFLENVEGTRTKQPHDIQNAQFPQVSHIAIPPQLYEGTPPIYDNQPSIIYLHPDSNYKNGYVVPQFTDELSSLIISDDWNGDAYNSDGSDEDYDEEGEIEEVLPIVSIIPETLYPPGEHYQVDGFVEPPVIINFIPGPWRDNTYDTGQYYEHYELLPVSFNLPDYADVSSTNTVPSSEHQDPINTSDSMRQRIPLPTPADKRHFHHYYHHHALIHDMEHKHSLKEQTPYSYQYPHQYTPETFNSHGADTTISKPDFPSVNGQHITINKQIFIAPDISPSGTSNIQNVQITGNNNAVSQSQTSNKAKAIAGHQNFQSTQIFGNQNSVSQSQSSNEAPFVSRTSNPMLSTPFIISVPRRRQIWRDANQPPQRQKRSIPDTSKHSELVLDHNRNQDYQFIEEVHNGLLGVMNEGHGPSRIERDSPLLRLIIDPNAKIDVPKSLENVGTVVRSSLEHNQAPLYHVKNMIGSAKDAFISTLKIPSNNFVIPSKYKIVSTEDEQQPFLAQPKDDADSVDSQAADNSHDVASYFLDTYQKIGNMLRESVRSGQEALTHLGEVAHNTRKAISATRNIAPKIVPPNIHHQARFNRTKSKISVVTPQILEVKHDSDIVGAPHYSGSHKEYVGLGHVLDALGISNPMAQEVSMRKTSFHPALLQSRANVRKGIGKYLVYADNFQPRDAENIEETLNELDNAKQVVGANSLKDFVLKMKNSAPNTFKNKLSEAKARFRVRVSQNRSQTKLSKGTALLDYTARQNLPSGNQNYVPVPSNAQAALKPGNFKPSATSTPKKYKSGNRMNSEVVGATAAVSTNDAVNSAPCHFINQQHVVDEASEENEIEDSVGAINPSMYKKIFNESLESAEPLDMTNPVNTKRAKIGSSKASGSIQSNDNGAGDKHISTTEESSNTADQDALGLKMGKKLVTPFMGKVKQEDVDIFYDDDVNDYGGDFDFAED